MHRTPGVSAQDNGDEFDDDTRDLDSNLDDDLEVDVVTPRPKSLGAIRAARRNKKMVGSRIVGSGLEKSEDLKTFSNPLQPGDRTPSPTRFDMFGTRNMWRDDLPAPTLNKARMCIMHPESTYKHLQDICLITVLIIYGIAVPYRWARRCTLGATFLRTTFLQCTALPPHSIGGKKRGRESRVNTSGPGHTRQSASMHTNQSTVRARYAPILDLCCCVGLRRTTVGVGYCLRLLVRANSAGRSAAPIPHRLL